jgi:hypothetical protein
MALRNRSLRIGGVTRRLPAKEVTRFEVVKGVLLGTLTLEQGARRMRITPDALARLVDGARRAVVEQGLEHYLVA